MKKTTKKKITKKKVAVKPVPVAKIRTVPEMLREAAETYEERNKTYGSTYKKHGGVVNALFPNGVMLADANAHNRFAIITMIVGKLTRYCQNFNNGGHEDSIHDLAVYAKMLQEIDVENNNA